MNTIIYINIISKKKYLINSKIKNIEKIKINKLNFESKKINEVKKKNEKLKNIKN